MNTAAVRAMARIRRLLGLAFTAEVTLDPGLDTDGSDPPRDPYAYSRVPLRPRPHPRSGGVALAEPDDEWFPFDDRRDEALGR
jgi:hypothetical protein